MRLLKKCRHGRGIAGDDRERAWRSCSCAWLLAEWDPIVRRWRYENVGADRRAAERALRARQAPHEGDGLSAVAERYLTALEAAGRAPRTIDQYRVYLARAEEWFRPSFPVAELTTARLEEFRAGLIQSGRDAGYAKHAVWFVRALVRQALREGVPGVERVPDLAPPVAVRRGRRSDRLTLDECERLVAALEPRWRTAGELILLTGLRIGELMALTTESVNLTDGVLWVHGTLGRDGGVGRPKSSTSRRALRLTPRARALVAARLLETRPGERLWPGQMEGACRGAIRRALVAAGLDAPGRGWHLLRHGHRDLLEAAGVSVRAAAARMGHGHQFATTESYGWGAEADDVGAVDEVRRSHGGPPASG